MHPLKKHDLWVPPSSEHRRPVPDKVSYKGRVQFPIGNRTDLPGRPYLHVHVHMRVERHPEQLQLQQRDRSDVFNRHARGSRRLYARVRHRGLDRRLLMSL